MKAEHRKELEKNVLVDYLRHSVTTVKGWRNSSLLVWLFVALVLVTAGTWVYMMRGASEAQSALWVEIDKAGITGRRSELKVIADKNRGTIPGRVARVQEARLYYRQALENFGSPRKHEEAVQELRQALALYMALADEASDEPVLQQEALLATAMATETLVATPYPQPLPEEKGPRQSGMIGTLDDARDWYQRLATAYPTTFQGEAARKRVVEIDDPETRQKIISFYEALQRGLEDARTKPPVLPPIPFPPPHTIEP